MTTYSKPLLATDIERILKSLLKGEHSSLSIEFNPHACNYIDAVGANKHHAFDHVVWASDEDRVLALNGNSVWILQWYQDSPVAFMAIAASSLEKLLAATLCKAESEAS